MGTAARESILDVAAGILIRKDGRVLMAERPADTAWAGYWEFPGGKIEPGETPDTALTREVREELGIEPDSAHHWITRHHAYPDCHVRLHIFRIYRWQGEPRGREGQQISWEDPHAVSVAPLLPANHQLLRALCLPPVYAITQASKYGVDEFMQRLQTALEKGIRLIQVRERMPADELMKFTQAIVDRAQPYGAAVIINGDEEIALQCRTQGLHMQSKQLLQCRQRPGELLVGASCHNQEELAHAASLGVDFAVLSPVLPTPSHPDEPTLGWDRFSRLCNDMPMPVYALGGMKQELLETATRHNAHGIAMLSGIW